MPPIFQDALDIARFRVKALEHYVYEWWQPVLWLTVLAASPVLRDIGRVPNWEILVLFSIVLNWVLILMFTFFIVWWVKRHNGWQGQGSLFPVVVLASTPQLINALIPFEQNLFLILIVLALLFYQFTVLIHALAISTGLPRRYMVNGLLLFMISCTLLFILLMVIAFKAGWIRPPPAAGKVPATVVPMGQS